MFGLARKKELREIKELRLKNEANIKGLHRRITHVNSEIHKEIDDILNGLDKVNKNITRIKSKIWWV